MVPETLPVQAVIADHTANLWRGAVIGASVEQIKVTAHPAQRWRLIAGLLPRQLRFRAQCGEEMGLE